MEKEKRLKYAIELDPIFIAQNVLLILEGFNRISEEKAFKEPLKLASLIYMVSFDELFLSVSKKLSSSKLNREDHENILNLKLKSKLVAPVLHRTLNLLLNKNLIGRIDNNGLSSIYLISPDANTFVDERYSEIKTNIKKLRQIYSKIATTSYNAYSKNVFGEINKYE